MINITPLKKFTQIYLVTNCYGDPNKVYIGKERSHKISKRENNHKKTFGKQIEFTYIDKINSCDYKMWGPLESFWIEYFRQLGFELMNKNSGGGGADIFSDETKRKITQNKLGKSYKFTNDLKVKSIEMFIQNERIIDISNKINIHSTTIRDYIKEQGLYINNHSKPPINQYDLQGNLIKEWNNIAEACITLGHFKKNGDIQSCCNGRQKTAFGYIWKYRNDNNPIEVFNPIYQFNFNGDIVNIFKSRKQVLEWCKINITKIDPNLNSIRIIKESSIRIYKSQNYCYSIKNKLDYIPKKDQCKKPILQYDLNGNFIREWESTNDFLESINRLGRGTLTKALKGELKNSYGYQWKYKY